MLVLCYLKVVTNGACIYLTSLQGVMEAIRISCAGYPTRKPFDEFVDRFGLLAPEVLDGRYLQLHYTLSLLYIVPYDCQSYYFFLLYVSFSSDEVTACKSLLEKVGLKGYQVIIQWGNNILPRLGSTGIVSLVYNCTICKFILAMILL